MSLEAILLGVVVLGSVLSVIVTCSIVTIWTLTRPTGRRSRG